MALLGVQARGRLSGKAMTFLLWIITIIGAAFAWLVLLASGMKTAPKLTNGSTVAALFLPGIALTLAIVGWTRGDHSIHHILTGLISLLAVFFVLMTWLMQPSPSTLARKIRMLLHIRSARWRGTTEEWTDDHYTVTVNDSPLLKVGEGDRLIELGEGSHGSLQRVTCREGKGKPTTVLLKAYAVMVVLHRRSGAITQRALFHSIGGNLVRLSLPALELQWHVPLSVGSPFCVKPVGDDVLVVGFEGLARFAAATGACVWESPQEYMRCHNLEFSDTEVLLTTQDAILHFAIDDGHLLRSEPLGGE